MVDVIVIVMLGYRVTVAVELVKNDLDNGKYSTPIGTCFGTLEKIRDVFF